MQDGDIADPGDAGLEGGNDVAPLVQDVGVDLEHPQHLGRGHVLHGHVLDEATPAVVRLDVEQPIDLVAGMAVVHVHPADAAGHRAADSQQAVALDHLATAHDDILRGHVQRPAVLVAAGLDHHGVVALVESAVLHDGMLGHLQVDAVVVVAMGIDIQVMGPDILAHEGVDGPERALPDLETIQLDVRAAVEVDQMRAHLHALALHMAVRHGDLRGTHRIELPRSLDMGIRTGEPRPPEIHLRSQHAGAGNGDVLAFEGIDERGYVHAFRPFPGNLDGGIIEAQVILEHDLRPLAQIQVAVALEMDGAGEPFAGRDDHAAAPRLVAGRHRLGERRRIGFHIARFRPVFRDGKDLVRKHEHLQGLERERRFRRGHDNPVLGGEDASGKEGAKGQDDSCQAHRLTPPLPASAFRACKG